MGIPLYKSWEALNRVIEEFGNLTSREAVMLAIEEYDILGREEFLHHYQFEVSKFWQRETWFLEFKGNSYPCKAIACVAYGYQYPEHGQLTSEEIGDGVWAACALGQISDFTLTHYHMHPHI
jgi:hypothetical protein